jgi:hypothetical protein
MQEMMKPHMKRGFEIAKLTGQVERIDAHAWCLSNES